MILLSNWMIPSVSIIDRTGMFSITSLYHRFSEDIIGILHTKAFTNQKKFSD
jgi:hypothetical protein